MSYERNLLSYKKYSDMILNIMNANEDYDYLIDRVLELQNSGQSSLECCAPELIVEMTQEYKGILCNYLYTKYTELDNKSVTELEDFFKKYT